MSYRLSRKLSFAGALALILVMLLPAIAGADVIVNDIQPNDITNTTTKGGQNEQLTVNIGQPQTVSFTITAAGSDGNGGCNFDLSGESLTATLTSSVPGVATVSPSTLTFTGCDAGNAQSLTVTAVAPGTTNIVMSCAIASAGNPTLCPLGVSGSPVNNTGGTFNMAPAKFTVTVPSDTTPPVVTVPIPTVAEATGPSGAAVTFAVSATDTAPASPAVTCVNGANQPVVSGDTFPLGVTTVTCSATDAAGNTGSNSFTITVQDTTQPVVATPSNLTVEATSAAGATVTYDTPAVTDAVTSPLTATCAPPSGGTFSLGATTVTCSATDAAGNTGSSAFTITVQDTTAPAFGPVSNVTVNATSPSGATVTYATPAATDAVTSAPVVTCAPPSGSLFAIGATTVTCSTVDAAGNPSSTTLTVTVVGATGQFSDLRAYLSGTGLNGMRLSLLLAPINAAERYLGSGMTSMSCQALQLTSGSLNVYVPIGRIPGLTVDQMRTTREMIATLSGAIGCSQTSP